MTEAAPTFEEELEILRTEAESAAQFLYAYLAIHEVAARHTEVENLLNTAPLFWNTTLGALQISAFIALGRVFDDDKGSHGVARLMRLAIASPQIFTRDALAARRKGNSPTKPEWLDEFMSTTYEPLPSDFEFLQQKVSEKKAVYEERYKPIRNKVFAHKDIRGNAKVHSLFAQTNISEWQSLTLFLQSLYNALWQLFHNGIKPDLREHPHAVADMIGKSIPAERQVPPHEKIAQQASEFLLTAAEGKP
jgi:hypothetical protein